jgi:hypothetical protein
LTRRIIGDCCATFTLEGIYANADTWQGTLTAEFCGDDECGCPTGDFGLSCDACSHHVWTVTGSR